MYGQVHSAALVLQAKGGRVRTPQYAAALTECAAVPPCAAVVRSPSASQAPSRSASGTVWYRPRLRSMVLRSTVWYPAVPSVRRRYPAVVAALLRAHPSIVDTDAEGFTPVHVAAMCYGNHGTCEERQARAPVVRANEGIAGLRPRMAALCYSNSAAAKKSRSWTYDGQRAARAVIVLPQYGKYWRSQCSAAMADWLRRDRRGADELQRFEDGPCADAWSVCPGANACGLSQ